MQKISVLGANGFIGSNLCRHLVKVGFLVTGFDRDVPSGFLPAGKMRWIKGDFLSPDSLGEALAGQDVVCHLVSTTYPGNSNDRIIFDVESNLLGTIRLLDAAVRLGVKKVVFISSGGTVYGVSSADRIPEEHPTHPINSYGICKLAIEKYLALYHGRAGLDFCALRVANPYGPNQRKFGQQGFIGTLNHKIRTGEVVEIWGDGAVVRDYLYIDDLNAAIERAVRVSCGEKVFNIGTGTGSSLNDVLSMAEDILGRRIERKYLPARAVDVERNVLDASRAERLLSWSPAVGLKQGLRKVLTGGENDARGE